MSIRIHVENVINKISKSLGVLKRASRFVPLQVRVTLYNTLVLHILITVVHFGMFVATAILLDCKSYKIVV